MKFRVYDSKKTNGMFATYFKTKKEALAFASTLENAKVEKKMLTNWVAC